MKKSGVASYKNELGLAYEPAYHTYILVIILKLVAILFYAFTNYSYNRPDLVLLLGLIYLWPYLLSLADALRTRSLRSAYPLLMYLITVTYLRRFFAEPSYVIDILNYITYVVIAHFSLSSHRALVVSIYGAIGLLVPTLIFSFLNRNPTLYTQQVLDSSTWVSVVMCLMIVWLGSRAYTNNLRQVIAALETDRNNLHKANEDYRTLFSLIVHDFSNDIAVIHMNLTALLRRAVGLEESSLKKVKASTARLNNLIDAISSLRKMRMNVESGSTLIVKSVNLNEILERVKFTFEPYLESKRIQFDIPDPKKLQVTLNVEPVSFSFHILNNLVSNAIKFSEPDTTIYITTEHLIDKTRLGIINTSKSNPTCLINNSARSDSKEMICQIGTIGEKGQGLGLGIVHRFCEKMQIELTHASSLTPNSNTYQVQVSLLIPSSPLEPS